MRSGAVSRLFIMIAKVLFVINLVGKRELWNALFVNLNKKTRVISPNRGRILHEPRGSTFFLVFRHHES